MRVPDETGYRAGELHIEDRKGWVYCCHCSSCPINHQNAIYTDGGFWCSFIRKWKRGDDLFEYRCPGYRPKKCSGCKNRYCAIKRNSDPIADVISYCNDFVGNSDRQSRFYGRRVAISDRAIESEERYIEQKKEEYRRENGLSDDKADGINEAGEYTEDKEGDEGMECVQISDSDKEDQIDFSS